MTTLYFIRLNGDDPYLVPIEHSGPREGWYSQGSRNKSTSELNAHLTAKDAWIDCADKLRDKLSDARQEVARLQAMFDTSEGEIAKIEEKEQS